MSFILGEQGAARSSRTILAPRDAKLAVVKPSSFLSVSFISSPHAIRVGRRTVRGNTPWLCADPRCWLHRARAAEQFRKQRGSFGQHAHDPLKCRPPLEAPPGGSRWTSESRKRTASNSGSRLFAFTSWDRFAAGREAGARFLRRFQAGGRLAGSSIPCCEVQSPSAGRRLFSAFPSNRRGIRERANPGAFDDWAEGFHCELLNWQSCYRKDS